MGKEYIQGISPTCKKYNQICGANKNLYRTIPSMIDGLKPGARRLIETFRTRYPDRKEYHKVAEIAGAVLALHPHGDAAIQDTLIALAQPWGNNEVLIDGKGNFGSPAGDEPAKGRYIEARISEYAWECFLKDFNDSNVDMKLSYTGKTYEPITLPAKYPHALINGSLGIGYGLSSNIPPYNFKEVLEATIRLIKEGPDIDITLVPDSPTGCYILDKGEFGEISRTGLGSYTMRSVVEIDEKSNKVVIKNAPYMVTSNSIKKAIIDLRDDKKTPWVKEQLISITDKSNYANGVMITLHLSQDANPYEFMEKLYKKDTGLEHTYPVNIKLIDDYTDYDYNIKSFLLDWLSYRRELKQTSYDFKLSNAMEEQHINDILLYILNGDNAEQTMKIAKESSSKSDFCRRLMATYSEIKMTTLQASNIASMPMYAFTKEAYKKYKDKKRELADKIAKYNEILRDFSYADKDIISELEDGIKKFGEPRRSKIINVTKKKQVAKTEHVLAISQSGLCKKLPIDSDYTGSIGGNSHEAMFMDVNNRDNILVFDEAGNVGRIKVSDISDSDVNDSGIPLSRYCTGLGRISAVVKEKSKIDDMSKFDLLFVTKNGFVKRTNLSEFSKIRGTRSAVRLSDGDLLSEVIMIKSGNSNKKDSVILYTNKGNGLRVSMSDIPVYGINSKGLRQITLMDDEYLTGVTEVPSGSKLFLYVTNNGKFKITESEYLPIMNRKSESINLIPLEGNETLRAIKVVNSGDTITVFRKSSEPMELSVADVPILTRIAKPKKMIPVSKGDYVAAIRVN